MRASNSPFCWAFSVPVRSVTRALTGGTGTSAYAGKPASMPARANHPASRTRRMEMLRLLLRRLAEIHLRRNGDRLLVLDREVGLRLVAEQHRREIGRERARENVVALHRLDIAPARYSDAVLGACEFGAQFAEFLG